MLDGLATTPFDPLRVEDKLRGYLKDWSGLALRHPVQTWDPSEAATEPHSSLA